MGVSPSSDDLGCRRIAETMSKGSQLAEEHLERSPGLRFSGNEPTWQKIPKSKQRQTRGKSLIRVILWLSQKLRFLSNIYEVHQKEDWCCFMPACRKDACWPPFIPLVALIDVVDRKISGLPNSSQRCTFHTLTLMWDLQKVSGQGATSSPVPLILPGLFSYGASA